MSGVKKILGGAAAFFLMSLAICFQTLAAGEARGQGEAEDEALLTDPVSLRSYEMEITVISPQEGTEIPQGFVSCSVTIDGQAVPGWVWGDDKIPEYCIFYAVNENGDRGYYRYDLTENTLQRYFHDPAGAGEFREKYIATAMEYNSLLHDYEIRFWIIMGLTAVIVILLIHELRQNRIRNRKTAVNGTEPGGKSIAQKGQASDAGASIQPVTGGPEQKTDGLREGSQEDKEAT